MDQLADVRLKIARWAGGLAHIAGASSGREQANGCIDNHVHANGTLASSVKQVNCPELLTVTDSVSLQEDLRLHLCGLPMHFVSYSCAYTPKKDVVMCCGYPSYSHLLRSGPTTGSCCTPAASTLLTQLVEALGPAAQQQ
eukprot:scaffold86724_cov21-Tisochrysis_lutea.AAC.1